MPYIHCQNLIKLYKSAQLEVIALRGIDLQIEAGEVIAIIGASGSGKSTFLNIIGGLDFPSAGTAQVGTHNLTHMTRAESLDYRRQSVGFVWQQTERNLLPYLTARQNVELPMKHNGISQRESRQRSVELLEMVGLADRMNHRPRQMSGGQQQRVAIAVAMANRPSVLLADEPTGQVDSESAEAIFQAIHTFNQAYGVTVIIVTHDLMVAQRVKRVVGMRDGRIINEIVRENGEEVILSVLDRTHRFMIPDEFAASLGLIRHADLQLHADHIELMGLES